MNIKYLQPIINPNAEYVSSLINTHENLVKCPHAPIHINRLQTRQDWKEFLDGDFYPKYFQNYDAEFEKNYDNSTQKRLQKEHRAEIDGVGDYLKLNLNGMVRSFGVLNFQKGVQTFSFWLYSHKYSEIMPIGTENAFAPMIALLDAGYLPRRVKTGWRVGYRTMEDKWKGIMLFGRKMM